MNRGSSFFVPAGAQDFWVPTWAPRGRITPRSFANLENWWDADDASTITIATGVSAWTDKAGGLDWSQSTAGLQPVRATGVAALNNRAVIQFDGTDDQLTTPSSFNFNIPAETIFLVAKIPTQAAFSIVAHSSISWQWGIIKDGGNSFEFYGGNTTAGSGSIEDVAIDNTTYSIFVVRRSVAETVDDYGVWQNGGASAGSTDCLATGSGTGSLSMGSGAGGSALNSQVAELFRYGRFLSFVEIDSICLNYLVPKWGAGAGEPSWTKMAA